MCSSDTAAILKVFIEQPDILLMIYPFIEGNSNISVYVMVYFSV